MSKVFHTSLAEVEEQPRQYSQTMMTETAFPPFSTFSLFFHYAPVFPRPNWQIILILNIPSSQILLLKTLCMKTQFYFFLDFVYISIYSFVLPIVVNDDVVNLAEVVSYLLSIYTGKIDVIKLGP